MKKLLLLDLDCTIRRPKSGAKFISSPGDQKIIPEAQLAIEKYQDWVCIGITNQGGVAAGFKTLESAIAETRYTLKLFPAMVCAYLCPDYEGNICWYVTRQHELEIGESSAYQGQFRKPSPGMLLHALAAHDGDRATSLYVGDRPEDEGAANGANVPFMWAQDWW